MKNNHGNNVSKGSNNCKANHKHPARKPRHRNHQVLLKRTALGSRVANQIPAKPHSPPDGQKRKNIFERKFRKSQTAETAEPATVTAGSFGGKDTNKENRPPNAIAQSDRSGMFERWSKSPRLTGAVAAVLLFVTLMTAIIPTGFRVNAEETDLAAAANPTMQLAKEYIYAGSRMLAIEDYGLSPGSTPTPTITPTPTETPTVTPTPALKPDLVISNFTATPGSPTEGDQVSFSVTVTNQGQGVMNGFLGVKYQIDGSCPGAGCPSHAAASTTINPGQSVTLNGASGTWSAVAGSHTLSAQVDDTNAIDESDETNNLVTLNINVNPPPTPTPTPTPAPAVPSIASVTANADPTCLDIALNGVSGADSYNVKVLSTGYTINVTSLNFPWCGLAPATYYEYQAQAVNQYGTSGWSGIVGGTTANPPPTPTPTPETYSIQVTGNPRRNDSSLNINWTSSVSRPASMDKIEVSTNNFTNIIAYTYTSGGTSGTASVSLTIQPGLYSVRYMKDGTTHVATNVVYVSQ